MEYVAARLLDRDDVVEFAQPFEGLGQQVHPGARRYVIHDDRDIHLRGIGFEVLIQSFLRGRL